MTIEERADRYIDKNFIRIAEMPIFEGMKTLYVESASEQKQLVREWIKEKREKFPEPLEEEYGYLECLDELEEWLNNLK